jgi:uncharacterized LabA/DUF88 family protein/cold shock CspA family protein
LLKAGIFLDVENLSRNGGWGIRYEIIKELVVAQGDMAVLRANAYLAVDVEREAEDPAYRQRSSDYRAAIRRTGFHLIHKEVRRFRDSEGELVLKANADLDLAVDALLQSDNLDYILLGSGDGDFLRLVRALQNRGKRVDLISFANASNDLVREVDNHFNGFLIPDVVPADNQREGRLRGVLHAVNEEKGFGFMTVRTGLGPDDVRYDVFCHISDVTRNGQTIDNASFAHLKNRRAIIEFDLVPTDDGRVKAVNAKEFRWTG